MSCIFKNLPDYGQVKVPLHVDLLLCLILTRLDNCYCIFYQKNGNLYTRDNFLLCAICFKSLL